MVCGHHLFFAWNGFTGEAAPRLCVLQVLQLLGEDEGGSGIRRVQGFALLWEDVGKSPRYVYMYVVCFLFVCFVVVVFAAAAVFYSLFIV